MTDKLGLFNGALRILGERRIVSLTENRLPVRVLNDIWSDGLVDKVLSAGQWQWATRTCKMDADTSVSTPFGYRYAFQKPIDCLRTVGISESEYFTEPLTDFADEARYWYTGRDTLYVRFVSNGAGFTGTLYGGDLANWPSSFCDYVEAFLAWKAGPRITGVAMSADALFKGMEKALNAAQGIDGVDRPTTFPSRGTWNRARKGLLGLVTNYNGDCGR